MNLQSVEEYFLPVTTKGVMRLTPRLRETYLSPEAEGSEAVVQSSGTEVRVWIWSERQNLRLTLQREGWEAGQAYSRDVRRWGININRYLGRQGVPVDETGEKPTVRVVAETFEDTGGEPRV